MILPDDNWHPDMPQEYRNQIVTGDARELAKRIPDESVDLIFTDPVYDRIDDYRWLAETAARVLKPDRATLVWCSKPLAAQCQIAMESSLEYVYTLDYVVPAKGYRLNHYHIFLWTTPCLWMQKGHALPNRWIPDTFISHQPPTNGHKWNKNEGVILSWLDAFCPLDGIVVDFFCGSGTGPAMATALKRRWLGFEIDPATADLARERVANTQPPLFVPEPEQLSLEIEALDEDS